MLFSAVIKAAATAAAIITTATAIAATPFEVRYEGAAPGQQNTTATFSTTGVESFATRPTGFSSFTTDYGTGGAITGAYGNVQINNADQYGGAGGTSKYAMSFGTYSLDLATTIPQGTNFFGYWLSALDGGNDVSFYSANRLLFTFKPADVLAAVNASPDRAQYFGNPNAPFLGRNNSQPYIFLSFFSNARSFDKIIFNQSNGGGYESDNHTVGRFTGRGTGTLIPLVNSQFPSAVPEPATWAMMLSGFGLVGATMRRRSRNVVTA